MVLERLDAEALETLLSRSEDIVGRQLPLDDDARTAVRALADGDGQFLLNLCEQLFQLPKGSELDTAGLSESYSAGHRSTIKSGKATII